MKYQLVAFGPAAARNLVELKAEFYQQIADIGLDPVQNADVLDLVDLMKIDWSGAPVGIWFGEEGAVASRDDLDLLDDFLTRTKNPVFPVCETLKNYENQVPEALKAINGQLFEVPSVVANVLRAFRLTREERNVFISYKRGESRGVAVQLYEAFLHRKYRAFLDTASVDAGVSFQEVLRGRLSNVDLLVFLDTASALSSTWVYEELNQAESQGMGIVQVLWPGQPRMKGTEFCDLFGLQRLDFENGNADENDRLSDSTLQKLLQEIERTRIRSIRTLRDRLIRDLVERATDCGLTAVVHPVGSDDLPVGHVEFFKAGRNVGRGLPTVGVPDARVVQLRDTDLSKAELPLASARIVYSEVGVSVHNLDHLAWLNESLSLQTQGVTAAKQWLEAL